MNGKEHIKEQCQAPECLRPVGRKLDPLNLPGGAKIWEIPTAKQPRKKGGRTGLGGRGNSKRRNYEAVLRSSRFRKVKAERFLMANGMCEVQGCRAEATDAAHVNYDNLGRETVHDIRAQCSPCNQKERNERHAPWNQEG